MRQIGCRRAVAVFMAYVYMFSINLGGMRREHAAIIMATVYLPIILYWIEKYLESRRFLYLGIAAAMMALQFMCGYMQGVLYSDIFVGLYLLIGGIIRKNTGWKKCFQHIAEWFIFYIGLISVQLIPFLELLRENSSFDLPKDTYEFFMQFSLHPVKLLQMMFPQFFGNIYDSIGSQYSSGIDIELYMGPVIVVMLLAGIKIYCKEKRILAYGIGATVIFCWGCMACFPGVAKMISKIPFLGATRIQSRVIFIFCFLVLLMASYIGELVARDNQGTAFSLCVVKNMKHILACVIIISIALLSYAVVQENGDSACEEILNIFRNRFMKDLILMLLTSAVLVLFVYAGKWKKKLRFFLLLVLLSINMAGVVPYTLQYNSMPVEKYLGINNEQSDFLKSNIGNDKVWEDAVSYKECMGSILYNNKGIAKKAACINSYTNFTNPRLYMMLNGVETAPLNESAALILCPSAEINLLGRNDMLSMLGVRYILDSGQLLNNEEFAANFTEKKQVLLVENVEGKLYERNLYVAGYKADIQENKAYKISLEACVDSETSIFVDFCGEQYDNQEQQMRFTLTPEKKEFSCIFFSGDDVPDDVLVRVIGNQAIEDAFIGNLCVKELVVDEEQCYRLVCSDEESNVYENLNANDVLYFSNTRALSDEIDLYTGIGNSLDKNSYIENGHELDHRSQNKSITQIDFGINRIQAEVSSDEESFVNFSQTYYPGWHAYVDGEEQDIHVVNGVIMGIYVPAGMHTVRFIFKPFSVMAGAVISAVSFVMLIIAIFVSEKSRCKFGKNSINRVI